MTSCKISYFLSLIVGVDMDQNSEKEQKKVEHGGVCYMLHVQKLLKSMLCTYLAY